MDGKIKERDKRFLLELKNEYKSNCLRDNFSLLPDIWNCALNIFRNEAREKLNFINWLIL